MKWRGEERNRHRGSSKKAFKTGKRRRKLQRGCFSPPPTLSLLERLQRLQRFPRSSLTRRESFHARVFLPRALFPHGDAAALETSLPTDAHPDLRRASSVREYFLLHARFSPPLDSIRNAFVTRLFSGIRPRASNGQDFHPPPPLPSGNQGTQLKPCSSLVNREKERGGKHRVGTGAREKSEL